MKPAKPYPDCPLFAHQNGQWAKKIDGKLVYFGTWDDFPGALKRYHASLDAPTLSVKACVKRYVVSRQQLAASDEMTSRHSKDIERTLNGLVALLGHRRITTLKSEDYGAWRASLAKTNRAVSLGGHISRVRAFLNWCIREQIIAALPPGDALKKPSRAQQRREKAETEAPMFEPEETRRLIASATPTMRAMILLGLNAGLGNADVARLRKKHLKDGWLVFPRGKTGIRRRVPLWKETIAALDAIMRDDDDVVFRTQQGNEWTPKSKAGSDNPVSPKFKRLCVHLKLYIKGRGFYAFRHMTETLGEESGDHAATQAILGHIPGSSDMASIYRKRMSDERLQKVVTFIHDWLYPRVTPALIPASIQQSIKKSAPTMQLVRPVRKRL